MEHLMIYALVEVGSVKKTIRLLLIALLLIGCTRSAVVPPQDDPVIPPVAPRVPVRMVRATLTVGGVEAELKFHRHGDNHVVALGGELTFEFDGPVDLNSSPVGSSYWYVNEEQTIIRTIISSRDERIYALSNLNDSKGHFVDWEGQYFITLIRTPFPAVKASLLNHPELEITRDTTSLAPKEVIKLEFAEAVDQQFVTEDISGAVRHFGHDEQGRYTEFKPSHTLHWVDDRTLHLTIDDLAYPWVSISPKGLDMIGWHFSMVPWQQVVVLGQDGTTLSQRDLPFSVSGVTGMYSNYGTVGLLRYSEPFWPIMGVTKYTLNLSSGNFVEEGSFPIYLSCDWKSKSSEARDRLELNLSGYRAYGLSSNGKWLAVQSSNTITIYDMTSADLRQLKTLEVSEKPPGDGDFPSWLYWSYDDTKLFFNAPLENYGWEGLFALDLVTGKESLIASGHYLLSVSPHGDRLFTRAFEEESIYCLMDFSGHTTRLNEPGETVTLTMWVDENRVLVNRNMTDTHRLFPADQECYLYYIDDDSFNYIADGYGFDYDLKTGRFFLLQSR
jgi:hypothetical protein